MRILNEKDSDKIANALKALGWTPFVGKVMSFQEPLGRTVGVAVKVGDERLVWRHVEPGIDASANPAASIANFFATVHIQAKLPELGMEPVGFAFTRVGDGLVQLHPGPDETLNEFIRKIRDVSAMQVQIPLFNVPSGGEARARGSMP